MPRIRRAGKESTGFAADGNRARNSRTRYPQGGDFRWISRGHCEDNADCRCGRHARRRVGAPRSAGRLAPVRQRRRAVPAFPTADGRHDQRPAPRAPSPRSASPRTPRPCAATSARSASCSAPRSCARTPPSCSRSSSRSARTRPRRPRPRPRTCSPPSTSPTAIRLARAFSTYFHLANVTEQVHRAREQRDARRTAGDPLSPRRHAHRGGDRGGRGHDRGRSRDAMSRLSARPVFTAHPTEAARRSVLLKLRAIADLLDRSRGRRHRPRRRAGVGAARPSSSTCCGRPTSCAWTGPRCSTRRATRSTTSTTSRSGPVAEVLDDLAARALDRRRRRCPSDARPLSFGSWIGGDRDGNPFVTPDVTLPRRRPRARPRGPRPAARHRPAARGPLGRPSGSTT